MEPKVIYEDNELLVLEKPAGIVVNRAETTRGAQTIQDWVEEKILRDKDTKKLSISDFIMRAGIVHRLDKETSGLLLVAKTPQAFENLQRQFKERIVKKRYLTLVHGKVEPETGEIKVPVGRLPWNRERFGVLPGGREAVSKYKVLSIKYKVLGKRKEPLTLLEVTPETGRTHQIRIHLKYLGHSVIGDPAYAGRKTAREDRKWCPRLFLHASFLGFKHPVSGEWLEIESLLPEDLEIALTTIKND